MKEMNYFKNNEVNFLQSKLEKIEIENSLLRKCSKLEKSKRFVSKNFIKSSPESSLGDKSGSELSKKLVAKSTLIFEKEYLLKGGNLPGSFPESNCKKVGLKVRFEDQLWTNESQQ